MENEDILLYEILPRLPVKSIFRFKSVCKKWRTFISNDPTFFKYHFQSQITSSSSSSSSSSIIIYRNHYSKILKFISTSAEPNLVDIPDPSLSFLTPPARTSLIASTNGLLCGIDPLYESTKFYVCNPLTQNVVYIPNPNNRRFAGLAFDPLLSSHFHIICPYRTDPPYSLQIHSDIPKEIGFEVFSSNTGVWRVSKAKLVLSNVFLWFHWLSIFNCGKLYWRITEYIIWFDPSKDCAGLVCSPPGRLKKNYPDVEIGECNAGRLHYTRITDTNIEIWVMREGEDNNGRFEFEWVKRYCVNWEGIFKHNQNVLASFDHNRKLRNREALDILVRRDGATPLPFGGGEVLCFWVAERGGVNTGNVFKYNLKTRELKFCHSSRLGSWFLYKSSLFPLPKLSDFHVQS